MIDLTYEITEEIYTAGTSTRTSYGIAAFANADKDGSATVVASVHDITSDKKGLSALVERCNRLELSTIHLRDVIEDFLSA